MSRSQKEIILAQADEIARYAEAVELMRESLREIEVNTYDPMTRRLASEAVRASSAALGIEEEEETEADEYGAL